MDLRSLKNKKIAIVGFGQEGKALANFLKNKNLKEIWILDKNPKIDIPKKFKKQAGKGYLKNLKYFDLIFLSPGVSPHLREFKAVKNRLFSGTRLFFENFKGKIIGITGTKGKGTTARLVYKILKKSFPKKKIFLGGNIGKPLISILKKTNKYSIVVAELSSFQLQDLDQSPQVAIITNLDRDHLNYHKTLKEYHQAKLNILRFQKKDNLAILNLNLKNKTKNLGKAKKYYFSFKESRANAYFKNSWLLINSNRIIKESDLKAVGKHIKEDILAASLTAFALKCPINKISQAIRNHRPDKHRLEFFYKTKNIKFFNDSAGTNPISTIQALESFEKEKIILIAGGQDKGFDYKKLAKQIKNQKNIEYVFLYGANKKTIKKLLKGKKNVFLTKDLKETVSKTKKLKNFKGIVLFSPASASLDMFKNYKQRGEIFKSLILKDF